MALVWITRTEPGATATAAKLRARGIDNLIDPLLTVEPLTPDVDACAFNALIVTSPNGLSAFCAQHGERHHTVFAVGDATAQAARQAGFAEVHSAAGDASDLIALLQTADRSTRYLYVAPETPARDLSTAGLDLDITPAVFYRTVERTPAEALSRLGDLTHVLLHSPRAARAAAPYLKDCTLSVVCISESATRAFRDGLDLSAGNLVVSGLNIEVAAAPDEAAMLDKL